MKKIIAFSLWGSNPKYTLGAIINVQLASSIFPDWECHFYYDKTVPALVITALNNFQNTRTVEVTDGTFGAFWRFRSMIPDTIVLSRDTDSRLSLREKQIVEDWLCSDSKLCTIRDHANHYEFPILAGMWGIRGGLDPVCIDAMNNFNTTHRYLVDQIYLKQIVWPMYEETSSVYGLKESMWMRNSYESVGKHFIGQTYDENNNPVYEPAL